MGTLPRAGEMGEAGPAEGRTETDSLGAEGGCCDLDRRLERMGTLQLAVFVFRCLFQYLSQ